MIYLAATVFPAPLSPLPQDHDANMAQHTTKEHIVTQDTLLRGNT